MIGSIMFHYFYDENSPATIRREAVSASDLRNIILNSEYRVISVQEWLEKYKSNKLGDKEVFISLDDGLKEQMDIAYPVLEDLGIKALWSIHSNPLSGNPDNLELFRYFRNHYFTDIDNNHLIRSF